MYGVFSFGGRQHATHRLAFAFANGRPSRAQVNHRCDVACCVNPAHLYEGTQLDNMQDRLRRGRWTGNKGEATHHKLTTAQVISIKRRRRAGETCAALAREFGVGQYQISRIATGKRWSHVAA